MRKTSNQAHDIEISVQGVIESFPCDAHGAFLTLRQWIMELAEEHNLGPIEETLKWGQPAYINKQGSTIRLDWSAKAPTSISIFFNCQTRLVESFREVYSHELEFQGNRVLIVDLSPSKLEAEIRHCLLVALRYHKVKHLPLLGM